jgi:hypothetical protein
MPTFVELVSRYVEIDPPRRFVVEGVRPSFAKAGRWTVELEELSGGTRGKTDFEITAPTGAVPFARLLLAFIHRGTRKSMLSLQQRLGPPR